jgi:hypothetical protein
MILSIPHDFAPHDFAFERLLNMRTQRQQSKKLRSLRCFLFKSPSCLPPMAAGLITQSRQGAKAQQRQKLKTEIMKSENLCGSVTLRLR